MRCVYIYKGEWEVNGIRHAGTRQRGKGQIHNGSANKKHGRHGELGVINQVGNKVKGVGVGRGWGRRSCCVGTESCHNHVTRRKWGVQEGGVSVGMVMACTKQQQKGMLIGESTREYRDNKEVLVKMHGAHGRHRKQPCQPCSMVVERGHMAQCCSRTAKCAAAARQEPGP